MSRDCTCDVKQLVSPPGCTCGGGRAAIERAHAPTVRQSDEEIIADIKKYLDRPLHRLQGQWCPGPSPFIRIWQRLPNQLPLNIGDIIKDASDTEYEIVGWDNTGLHGLTAKYPSPIHISRVTILNDEWYKLKKEDNNAYNNNNQTVYGNSPLAGLTPYSGNTPTPGSADPDDS